MSGGDLNSSHSGAQAESPIAPATQGDAACASAIFAEEIGILAYFSERPVEDPIGLVSPRSLPYAAVGDMAGAFLARPTDYVVFHTFNQRGGTRPVVARPWFARAYAGLSQDAWLAVAEPERIARLKERGSTPAIE